MGPYPQAGAACLQAGGTSPLAGCLASAACKVPAETLRSLERDDLASRRPVTGAPERTVEYELSEPGRCALT
jgi:hypothetical protein